MNRKDFQSIIEEIKQKSPRLFALESDTCASNEMIHDVEKYYGVIFPDSYKDFVNQYGGGYFGFIAVYSCDMKGQFFIKNNVSKEWVHENKFMPIIDCETGDLFGFEIQNGICESSITMYLHEENIFKKIRDDLYETLLKYGLHYNK